MVTGTTRTETTNVATQRSTTPIDRAPPRLRIKRAVTVPAAVSAATKSVVFIDTPAARPSASPPKIALRRGDIPLTQIASAASQQTIQRSSVRYSSEPRKNGGVIAASAAAQNAVRLSKSARA